MVNPIYDELRGVTRELMSEFKQGKIEYVKVTPGEGPADDPGDDEETVYEMDATATGVPLKYVNNTTIVGGDMMFVAAVRDDVTPEMNGFVRVDDVRYKIKRIDPIPPAGVTVANRVFFGK